MHPDRLPRAPVPEARRPENARHRGFTLVEIMIVVLIIGILVSIAVPQWVNARTSSRKSTCISNLKRIDAAKDTWAMETKKTEGAACDLTILAPTYLKTTPTCPTSGTYTVGTVGTTPTCTITGHAL